VSPTDTSDDALYPLPKLDSDIDVIHLADEKDRVGSEVAIKLDIEGAEAAKE
jgi:hypothetical protein